jgi:DNA-binding transcriptional LysR family regulator
MGLRPKADSRTRKRGTPPWLGIELRHLAALQAVADEGSFNGAAAMLGYTQSAISQQIAALERIVGQRLVDRGTRAHSVEPTEAGRSLLRHTRAILGELAAAHADLDALADGRGKRLRIGVYESAGARLLPRILREFMQGQPDVDVDLVETIADPELLDLLAAGELDLAFAILPLVDGPFEVHPLISDGYVLVIRDTSPLAGKQQPTVEELAALPLICLKDCRSADHAIALLEATSGVRPEVVFRAAETGTVEGMVEAGVGVALMPSLAFAGRPGLVGVPLGELVPPRVTAIVRHRDRDLGEPVDDFLAASLRIGRRVGLATARTQRAA